MPSLFAPCRRIHDKVFEVRAVASLLTSLFSLPALCLHGVFGQFGKYYQRIFWGIKCLCDVFFLRLATDLDISLTGDDCGCES